MYTIQGRKYVSTLTKVLN